MKYSICLLICFVSWNISAQEGTVVYKATLLTHKMKPGEYRDKIEREINATDFSLTYNSKISFFKAKKRIPFDKNSGFLALAIANANIDWYQKAVIKKAFFNQKISGKTYMVHQKKMEGWEFSNETKKIGGYNCLKASIVLYNTQSGKGRLVEAWYTPEIPVPYGPIGFGGLPGLILEVKYWSTVYSVDTITLNPKEGIKKIQTPNETNPIPIKQMSRLMRSARKVTED